VIVRRGIGANVSKAGPSRGSNRGGEKSADVLPVTAADVVTTKLSLCVGSESNSVGEGW